MEKQKQIEEMARDFVISIEDAKYMYEVEGYRQKLNVVSEIFDIINELKTEIETAETSLIDEDQKISCLAVLMLLQTKIMERYGV